MCVQYDCTFDCRFIITVSVTLLQKTTIQYYICRLRWTRKVTYITNIIGSCANYRFSMNQYLNKLLEGKKTVI